jgi:hypothetical protein
MTEDTSPSVVQTPRKPLPRWLLLTLLIGVPLVCIAFCKLVGMGNIETAAFTILCIFGICVTYFTR